MNDKKIITKEEIKKEIEKLQEKLKNDFFDFETILIMSDSITYYNYAKTIEDLKALLQDVKKIDELGMKKLAYKIKGHENGVYIDIFWSGTTETAKLLDEQIKNNDNILKHMTIRNLDD